MAMLEAVRDADLVLIGGGGIFHDYWGFNPNTVLTDNHWGISYYTGPAVFAALLQKPVMLYAVGIGPLLSAHGKSFTKIACDLAQVITVRDPGSKDILRQIGVPDEKVQVTADPVFALPQERIEPANLDYPKPLIGVALRNWDIGVHPSFWEQEVAAGLDAFLKDNQGSVLLIPAQRLDGKIEDDLTVARRIHGFLKTPERACVLEEKLSTPEILSHIRECGFIIGMRLHAIILAVLAEVPAIALCYDPKVQQAMERIGLQRYTVDIRSIDAAHLSNLLRDCLEQAVEIRGDLKLQRENLDKLARQNAEIAAALMDKPAVPVSVDNETLALLARGIHAQLKDARELRTENRRLLGEVDFYQRESQSHATHSEQLSTQLLQLESERDLFTSELERIMEGDQTAQIEKLSHLYAALESERSRNRLELETLQHQLQTVRTDLHAKAEQVNALQDQVSRLQSASKASRMPIKSGRASSRGSINISALLKTAL